MTEANHMNTNEALRAQSPETIRTSIELPHLNSSAMENNDTHGPNGNKQADEKENNVGTQGLTPSHGEREDSATYNESVLEGASEDSMDSQTEAYAKLQCLDSDFYMTTLAVELGRFQNEAKDGPFARLLQAHNGVITHDLQDIETVQRAMWEEGFNTYHPLDCPLVGIGHYSRNDGLPVNRKSISRRHARIAYNSEHGYFEILFIGRNGGFLDDEWIARGDKVPLVNGSIIQIGGASVKFLLPNVPEGETGGEHLEDGEATGEEVESTSESGDRVKSEDNSASEENTGRMATRGRRNPKPEAVVEPKELKQTSRKGPGRPPKNGIMSKREEAELAKQAKEDSKGRAQKPKKVNNRGRGKTAKAIELEESSTKASGIRKYTKRKKSRNENPEQKRRDSSDQTDFVPPERAPTKTPKEKRPAKPPRSPSPVWDESKLTPEQLAKPNHSYVVLIHDALTASPTGQMSLPQIYRAIERKYPYFKLKVTTQGWQSSVRHNLGQHAAFKKIQRDGKGWMWGIDPAVSIEKEKKRRATPPPPPSRPQYYPQQSQQPRQGHYPYPVQYPLPNAKPPTNGYAPMNGCQYPGMQHGSLPPRPPYVAAGFPPIILNPHSDTYQSPYDRNSNGQAPQSTQANTQTKGNHETNCHLAYAPTAPVNTQSNGLHHGTSNTPPQEACIPQGLPLNLSNNIKSFRQCFLDHMEDKARGEALVDSAIGRKLNPSVASQMTHERDLDEERDIMNALDKVFSGAKRETHGSAPASFAQGQTGIAGAAQKAEDAVRSIPLATAYQARCKEGETNVVSNGSSPGHKRTVTADETELPLEKKRSTS